jgi:CMP-N,N'-diacetyllegionaminic acid synthase
VEPRNCVAFVPARSASERLPDKNIKDLRGHPLIAYTISAALDSGCFGAVVVSTDSASYAEIARHYGAETPFLRPEAAAGATSPDIEWVVHAIERLAELGRTFSCFSILRPTSPFRQPETIRRAMKQFSDEGDHVDSLRAVEPCRQHPGKMWIIRGRRMMPLLPHGPEEQPWHSSQMKALPKVYAQNASLEIAWTRVVVEDRLIAGNVITPFLTEDFEGLDINGAEDWWYANYLIEEKLAHLPVVRASPYSER